MDPVVNQPESQDLYKDPPPAADYSAPDVYPALPPEGSAAPPAMPSAPLTEVPAQEGGPVTIQCMTAEDANFAGDLTYEAFRSKMLWASSEADTPIVKHGIAVGYSSSPREFHRHFIASYNGQRAGILVLRYYDSKAYTSSAGYEGISFCGGCGLTCMESVLKETVQRGMCYIDHVGVSAEFRGRGIGKALLERAEWEAKKNYCNTIYLYVAHDNRAKELYKRQGYKTVFFKGGDSKCSSLYCYTGITKFLRMEKFL